MLRAGLHNIILLQDVFVGFFCAVALCLSAAVLSTICLVFSSHVACLPFSGSWLGYGLRLTFLRHDSIVTSNNM